jgi:CP family cyanate transporter-like MFS transporter
MGITLVALGLRDSATAVSPILQSISQDITFASVDIGLLGMLAPLTFAVVGAITPWLAKRLGLEWSIIAASALIAAGQLVRASANETSAFLFWTFVTMAGTGAANVLLPPLVKKFFPDRIATMSTIYLFIAVVGSVIPAYLAAPLMNATDWRTSVAAWSSIAVIAIVPWVALLVRERGQASTYQAPRDAGITKKVWRSRTAWGMAISFGIASFNCYIMWSWLPILLQEHGGLSQAESGLMLAMYSAVALLTSLFGPGIIARLTSMAPVVAGGMLVTIIGALGLWFAPGFAPWLWSILSGGVVIMFTVGLVLINLRTSGPAGAVALSGMVQGVGYLIGALGPLIVGIIHSNGNDWTWEFVVIIAATLIGIFPLVALRKKVMVDA